MSRRTLALMLLVVAASLAGCNAVSNGDGPTATPSGDAQAIASDAAATMESVETYRVTATIEQTVSANNQQQTATVTSTAVFDRGERAFRITRATSAAGRTREAAVYLVNGTLYERNPAYERRYGSAWVKVDVAENLTETWRAQDTLTRQRLLLENATVTYEGTATVNGTKTDVLAVDGNESAFESVVEERLGGVATDVEVSVENVSFTHYVAVESDRLRRSIGTLKMQVSAGARTVSQTQRMNLTFSGYGAPVDVTLPEGAAVAVSISNESAG
ncbi:MAG: DUF6612 family protein [Halobacteriaceae archaeon]